MNRSSSNSLGLAEILPLTSYKPVSISTRQFIVDMDFFSRRKRNKRKEIPRYLYVSNGYEIFCLNLEEGEAQSFSNADEIPLLPKIGTLDLREKGLSASVGLFNLGPEAYMIGGQRFPASLGKPSSLYQFGPLCGINLYQAFCFRYKVKGTSRDIYALSLVDHILSPSKSDIVQLKKPKLWPIVEKIDGRIHVIDSLPPQLARSCTGNWITSHEVLSCDHDSWSEISTVKDMGYIVSHLVVGHRIYAVSDTNSLVFDSRTGIWEAPHPNPRTMREDPFTHRDVWHILDSGIGRCVGGFTYGKADDPLYVLIAVVHDKSEEHYPLRAVAYLVTSMGEVVCVQSLPHLLKSSVELFQMESGKIIDVDEKENKMCLIMDTAGKVPEYLSSYYAIIATFTVERVPGAESKIEQVWAKRRDAWAPVEQDFVRVDIEGSYIYRNDDGWGTQGMLGVRACLLPVSSSSSSTSSGEE